MSNDMTFIWFMTALLLGAVLGMALAIIPGYETFKYFAMVLVPLCSVLSGFIYYKLEVAEY